MPKKIKMTIPQTIRKNRREYVKEWLEKNKVSMEFMDQMAVKEGLIEPGQKLSYDALYTMAVSCELKGVTLESCRKKEENDGQD